MRKSCFANNLFALAVAAMLSTAASAQTQKMASSRKWDGAIQHCITAKPTQSLNVLVKCQQAEKLCAFLHNKGYRATLVANQLVSARIPATLVQYVAQNFDTEYIQTPRQAKLTMNNARPAANVEKAHKGEGLLTPYTGKGVIIGVIDQGFEYRHLAFLDENGNSRVKALWNRRGFSEGTDTQPTTDIPASGDGVGDIGHATFVTNVAAGSPISENNFYGVAPGADIVMVSSELSEDEVLEDISYISSLAHTEGKPWVVNMSFGTQMGAHDGKSYFDQALNTLLDNSKACQIVAAVGNDNQHNMHAAHTFTNNRNTVKMIVNPAVMVGTNVSIWCQQTDSAEHLTVRPFILQGNNTDYKSSEFWAERISYNVAPYNGKQNIEIKLNASDVAQPNIQLGIEVSAEAGVSFDAWVESNFGYFEPSSGEGYALVDNVYCVSEMGASVANAIAVGSFVSRATATNTAGETLNWFLGNEGELSTFSNHGPMTDNTPKPDITAPGSILYSAYAKTGSEFSNLNPAIVQTVKRGLRSFYYGASYGTSFSAPIVTGTIALWLEANPNLTSSEIKNILCNTATKPASMNQAEWTSGWGYGQVNAYEGLKEALRLADASGIPAINGSTQPITISKENQQWRLLLNSNEPFVNVSVYQLNGSRVSSQQFGTQQRGNEIQLNLSNLTAGTYIVRIETQKAKQTLKIFATK